MFLTLCAAPSAVSRQARNYSTWRKRESRKMTQEDDKSSRSTRGVSRWPAVTHHLSFIVGTDTQSRVSGTLTQRGTHGCRLIPGLCRPPRNPPSTGICSPPPAPRDYSLLPRVCPFWTLPTQGVSCALTLCLVVCIRTSPLAVAA